MNNLKIYTTPIVEGTPIEMYLGVVTANQVAGTGFFTDLTASFSDLFGGNSGAYRNAMNSLYEEVIDQLCSKATLLGANGIVGVTVAYDSISAKNMSMFMVSVQGTAVRFKETEANKHKPEPGIVSVDTLTCEVNKKVFAQLLNAGYMLSDEQWKFVLSHDMPELAHPLLNAYKTAQSGEFILGGSTCKQNVPLYISKLPYDNAVELLYSNDKIYTELITSLNLFNASKILELAMNPSSRDTALSLLLTDKLSYNSDDLKEMKMLLDYLQSLPDVGKIEEVKGGIFSSKGVKFHCSCGAKNDSETKFCESCGRNIKGLKREQVVAIERFKQKVETLSEILSV